jgi:uncharacterized protein
VACVSPDPEKAVAFYTELFGWEAESLMPPGSSGSYFLCTLRGRPVAAVVSFHGAPPPPGAVWTTFICVESADDTSSEVTAADGSVIGVPGRLAGGGRMAVVADPAGAVFTVSQLTAGS